jgi:hypothetical protein
MEDTPMSFDFKMSNNANQVSNFNIKNNGGNQISPLKIKDMLKDYSDRIDDD